MGRFDIPIDSTHENELINECVTGRCDNETDVIPGKFDNCNQQKLVSVGTMY